MQGAHAHPDDAYSGRRGRCRGRHIGASPRTLCGCIFMRFTTEEIEVVLASPAGGAPWMGPTSPGRVVADEALRRFRQDGAARDALTDTIRLDQAYAEDFEGALCLGAPGPIWRRQQDSPAAGLIAGFLAAAKPVAIMPSDLDLVPHGTGRGLLITGDSAGTPLLAAHALIGAVEGRASSSEKPQA